MIGVVSEADILIKEQGQEVIPHRQLERVLGLSATTRSMLARRSQATSAVGAMTSPAITIGEHASVAEAARVMTRAPRQPAARRISGRRLVGIVTRADLVRAFVRTDEELVTAPPRRRFVEVDAFLNPLAFEVSVDERPRSLIRGHVERRSEAELDRNTMQHRCPASSSCARTSPGSSTTTRSARRTRTCSFHTSSTEQLRAHRGGLPKEPPHRPHGSTASKAGRGWVSRAASPSNARRVAVIRVRDGDQRLGALAQAPAAQLGDARTRSRPSGRARGS